MKPCTTPTALSVFVLILQSVGTTPGGVAVDSLVARDIAGGANVTTYNSILKDIENEFKKNSFLKLGVNHQALSQVTFNCHQNYAPYKAAEAAVIKALWTTKACSSRPHECQDLVCSDGVFLQYCNDKDSDLNIHCNWIGQFARFILTACQKDGKVSGGIVLRQLGIDIMIGVNGSC